MTFVACFQCALRVLESGSPTEKVKAEQRLGELDAWFNERDAAYSVELSEARQRVRSMFTVRCVVSYADY